MRWIRILVCVLFAALLAVAAAAAYPLKHVPIYLQAQANVVPRIRPRPPALVRIHWLAECETDLTIPVNTNLGSGISVAWIKALDGRVLVGLSKPPWRYIVALQKLGSRETGWNVWEVSGPAGLKTLMTNSPRCRNVLAFSQVLSAPAAVKAWLSPRLTCYGLATWRGRTYRRWPCAWSYNGRTGSVSNLAGVGPALDTGFAYPPAPLEGIP